MKKYIARQIAEEWQESPLADLSDYEWDMEWPGFSVYGNKRYKERMTEEFKALMENDALEEASMEFDSMEFDAESARLSCVEDIVGGYIGYEYVTDRNVKAWESVLCKCYKHVHDGHGVPNDVICHALEVMTDEPYISEMITGSTQGEWQYCFHPANYNADHFAIEYFNMGTEWEVCDTPVMVDMEDRNLFDVADEVLNDAVSTYRIYCHSYNTESIRDEIADNLGVKPEEVLMWAFKGYRKIADYEMI